MSLLGILVKTASRREWVSNLAQAAADRKKSVWVHFAEQGVRGMRIQEIENLSRYGKVSVCRTSAERFGMHPHLSRQWHPYLAPPSAMAELVSRCDRLVVL